MYEDKHNLYFVQECLTGKQLLERFIDQDGNFSEDYVRKIMK